MTLRAHAELSAYDHSALLYHSEREYVDWLVRFISEGLDRAQPVLVAVPGDRLATLRQELGDSAADVTMADIMGFGRNPGRILAAQLAFVERHPGRHVRIIAEPVWEGRTAYESSACMQHEALANIAFAGLDVTGLCPYDASCLSERVLADVGNDNVEITAAEQHMTDEQFIVFRLGAQDYGLPSAAIKEITKVPEQIVRMPWRRARFLGGWRLGRGST